MDSVPSKAANPPRPLGQNRRRGNRHRLQIPATVLQVVEDRHHNFTEISVIITEISVGGVGFRSLKPLKIDATYLVSSFDTLIPHGLRARIISQRQSADGEFEIGAKTL